MSANNDNLNCQSDQIAAYLDGELDEVVCVLLEDHLKRCADCSAELAEQRLLLCTLDSTLSRGSSLPLPADFARMVAARAESDMSGVRNRSEHRRTLQLCALLAGIAFVLLGVAASKVVLSVALKLVDHAAGAFDLAWTTSYDAMTGLTIVSRVLGKGFIPGSLLAGLLVFLLLAFALLLLSRLISNYHRTRLID
jgi:anti-sigma factor RsiW